MDDNKETHVFSAATLLEMQPETEAPESEVDEAPEVEDTLKLDETTKHDVEETPQLLSLLTSLTADAPSAYRSLLVAAEDLGAHSISMPESIELTPTDKDTFADAILDNKDWVSEFTCMGGKLTGKLKSRTISQTGAIMGEVQRRYRNGELESGLPYCTALLSCFLYMQLVEVGGVRLQDKPTKDADLQATAVFDGETTQIVAPEWYAAAQSYTSGMGDVKLRLLVNQLAIFETKYWQLGSMINSESFWQPED